MAFALMSSGRATSTMTFDHYAEVPPAICDATQKTVDSLMKMDLPSGVEVEIKV